jgi:hypothetical protein|tara:strand:- start:76 stop:288 length:213 start_codon:yes stop_codon:yes gene_type:complete
MKVLSKLESLKKLYVIEALDTHTEQELKQFLYEYWIKEVNEMTEHDFLTMVQNHFGQEWIEVNTNMEEVK